MRVEDLIMLLKQCDQNAKVEIMSEYDDIFLPYEIEEHPPYPYITIMTMYKEKETKGD